MIEIIGYMKHGQFDQIAGDGIADLVTNADIFPYF